MRIQIAAIGRFRASPEKDLFQKYIRRSRWPISLHEIELKKKFEVSIRIKEEESLLLRNIPKEAIIVVLDEKGINLSSVSLAQKIATWQTNGHSNFAFLIGGENGVTDSLRQRADFLLALGTATWPHLLVRTLLAEQLYRAETILAGLPYHREG